MRIKLDSGAFEPIRAHEADAGLDLRTPKGFIVWGKWHKTIDTGVHVEMLPGRCGFLKSKSGLNVKKHITSDGVIDAGYTGSIRAKLYNHGFLPRRFKAGDKITQLVILPISFFDYRFEYVEELEETERGSNGFGSTGR